MKVGFIGLSHLGKTLMRASEMRGFATATSNLETCDIVMVTQDIEDHDDLSEAEACMQEATALPSGIPVVLVSQIVPGFTRRWRKVRGNLFYQVDTIIMNCALERCLYPERFIIGCEDPAAELPPPYAHYLAAFNCPVVKMNYESAELSKMAINYFLAKQLETTNQLAKVANLVRADWSSIIPGLQMDRRIGNRAYLQPGRSVRSSPTRCQNH